MHKYISDNVLVGENVKIGRNTHILWGTYICDNISVGENCVIGANCSIAANIGDNVTVDHGCVVNNDVPDNYIIKSPTPTSCSKVTPFCPHCGSDDYIEMNEVGRHANKLCVNCGKEYKL